MNKTKVTLNIKGMEFYCCHGLYPIEARVKQRFVVDISLDYEIQNGKIQLEDCIDYTSLADLIKTEMEIPEQLLENLALRIRTRIVEIFEQCIRCTVAITKHPQLGGNYESVKIEI
jgi:dihydroneopterin aldolase